MGPLCVVARLLPEFMSKQHEREARFRVTDLRALGIDTQRWLVDVSFTLHLKWPLTFEDVTAIQDGTKQWQPPQLVVKNALTCMIAASRRGHSVG